MEKRSVDKLFVHYFHNFLSASGSFAGTPPDPTGAPPLDSAGGLSSPDP